MQVLASAVSRVTHAAHAAQVQSGSSYINSDQVALAKQQQVLGATAQAVADEVRAGPHPDLQGAASVLVAAAHSVVVGAAQLVVTDRVAQATRSQTVEGMSMTPAAQAPISVTEVSVATQSAVAHAVALNGPMATDVEVMMTANALIQQQQIVTTNEALEATQATSHMLNGTTSGSVSPQMGQMGDHRSRSMSSLTNSASNMPMNVGLATGLGPGLDGMSAIPSSMHGMTGLVSGGLQ
jgi:type IV secretory pathway VirB3-like protein